MHPGFGVPGIQHHHQQEQLNNMMENHHENTSSMIQTHNTNIVEQIHNLATVPHHNLFMDHNNNNNSHHHFLPAISHNHYMAAASGSSSAYYPPVNFKLGLNEINCSNITTNERDCNTSINGDGAGLVHGSEQYEVPDARHTPLEMQNHCWHNPQDSSTIKQPPFWEPLPAEVSNENSEIIDRLENIKMNQKQQPLRSCTSHSKTRLVYGEGELEAIYKCCGTSTHDESTPAVVLPRGQDHQGSDEASIEASVCLKDDKHDNNKKKKKKRKERSSWNEFVQFFEKLAKQVVDHQENLHAKFVERMERLDGERREKEEAWRSRELVYFEQEAAARAREKAMAATREDTIVSYLEKITGQNIPNLPSFNPSNDFQQRDGSPNS